MSNIEINESKLTFLNIGLRGFPCDITCWLSVDNRIESSTSL